MLCVFQKKKKIDVKSPNLLAVHREMQGKTNFRHISGSQECRSSINLQFLLLKIYISELEHSFDPYLMSTHYIPYIRYFAISWNCVGVYSWFQWLYYLQNERNKEANSKITNWDKNYEENKCVCKREYQVKRTNFLSIKSSEKSTPKNTFRWIWIVRKKKIRVKEMNSKASQKDAWNIGRFQRPLGLKYGVWTDKLLLIMLC